MKKGSNLISYFIGIIMPIISINSVWGKTVEKQGEPFSTKNVTVENGVSALEYKVEPGKYITFDASGSFDPDGDVIDYTWIYDEQTSTYSGLIDLVKTIPSRLEFEIPTDLNDDTLVFELKLKDNSKSVLSTLKQIILFTEKTFMIVSEPKWTAKPNELYTYKLEFSFNSDDNVRLSSSKLPEWLEIKEINIAEGYLIFEGIPLTSDVVKNNSVEIVLSNGNEELSQSFEILIEKQYFNLNVTGGNGSGVYAVGDTVWIIGDSANMTFEEWTGDVEYLNDQYNSISYIIMPESHVLVAAKYDDSIKSGEIDSVNNMLTFSMTSSEDDAEELRDGSVILNNHNLELVSNNRKSVGNNAVGLIFRNISIPAEKNVVGAFIRFNAEDATENSNMMKINGVLEGNCRPFTEWENDITSRELTQNLIEWKPFSWTQKDNFEYTTDLSEIVTEVMSQDNWEQGNAIGFVFTGYGGQIAKSYDGASNEEERPTLILKLGDKNSVYTKTNWQTENCSLTIYPNPANNVLNVETNEEVEIIQIADLTGRILTNTIYQESSINLTGLMRGNYIVIIKTIDGKTYSRKFLKL